jgi:hypothetical protein
MRSWQIRIILTTIALAACCGVATAGLEGASSKQPQASSGARSEMKQPTPARPEKGRAKSSATAKEKAAAKTEKQAVKSGAGAKTETNADVRTRVRITGALSNAGTTADVEVHGIEERARWAPKYCTDTDNKLEGTLRAVDKEAAKGDGAVSVRMVAEFRISPEAILSERTRLSAGWGELLVAHTLLANTKSGITIDHLFDMRDEGMGWGQIAHGLGLKQNEVVTAVRAEGRVIRGKSKPGGSPSPIASVEPQEGAMQSGAQTSEVGAGDVETSVRGAAGK